MAATRISTFARHRGQVARARVANRNRGVFVQQEHGTGFPTISLRPITTARAPLMGILERFKIFKDPRRGAGHKARAPRHQIAHVIGCNPSTSFGGSTAMSTRRVSI